MPSIEDRRVDPGDRRLLAEISGIAELESAKEGSGCERARGLLAMLLQDVTYSADDYEIVIGTPPRWEACDSIEVGYGEYGCWRNSVGWVRFELRGYEARVFSVAGAEGDGRWYRAEEGLLSKGEFLAVVRAYEVIAAADFRLRWSVPDPSGGGQYDQLGSLRVLGGSGVRCQERFTSLRFAYESPGVVRCQAAAQLAFLVMSDRNLRRFRPVQADRDWLHAAYRDMRWKEEYYWWDRCHESIFEAIGDPEGLALSRRHDPR